MRVSVVFWQMMMMLLLMAVGYACRKKNVIGEGGKQMLSALVVQVFNPALLVYSITNNQNPAARGNAIIMFGAGTVMYVVLIVLAYVLGGLESRDKETRVTRHLMYVFANTGFIGIPVVRAVLGEEYIIYVAVINVLYSLILYTWGYQQVREGEKFSLKSLKKLFNIGTIAAVAGMILFFGGVKLPSTISQTLGYLGNATTPVALMIVGVTMAEQEHLSSIFKNTRIYLFCVLKMLVIPILSGFLLKLVPLPEEIRQVLLFMIAVPVGNMPLLMILEQGKDSRDCSDSIILTTILSILTIPAVVFVYLHF